MGLPVCRPRSSGVTFLSNATLPSEVRALLLLHVLHVRPLERVG